MSEIMFQDLLVMLRGNGKLSYHYASVTFVECGSSLGCTELFFLTFVDCLKNFP